jgi:prepilin-type N-terminal cleavage/methylation domain-containing protein
MKEASEALGRRRSGYTLVEVLIATALAGMVLAGALAALSNNQRMWIATDNEIEGSGEAMKAVQLMVSGAYGNPGLRMAEWDPSVPTPAITTVNGSESRVDYQCGTNSFYFTLDDMDQIVDGSGNVLCTHVDSVEFTLEDSKPGTIRIDLVIRRIGAPAADQFVRLVSWVACRNRPHSS